MSHHSGSESDQKGLTKGINEAVFTKGGGDVMIKNSDIYMVAGGNFGTAAGTAGTRSKRVNEESLSTTGNFTTGARPKRTVKKDGSVGKKTDFLSSSIDKENLSSEEQEEFSTSDSSEENEDVTEGCVQLSDSIWMFPDRRISTHGEIYEGEFRSGILDTRPIVLKLANNIPQSITEARILAKLNHHSYVLSLIQAGTFNCGPFDQIYIALDKCHHKNLREFVTNRKDQGFAFNLSQAIEIAQQMVDGVKYIHENRIIHKDLKPDNILFSLDQRFIKIAGFGLSQEIESTSTEVFEKGQFGTDGFRPPESFGKGIISQKSDIFSLGVIFHFVLSNGEHPFGEDRDGWNYRVINGIIDLSGLLVPNIKTTEHLIKSMIEHKIKHRPTIWQVSEHPFWTGNEVSCDFDYHSPESSMSLIHSTSEGPSHNIADLNQFLEHMKEVKLRDQAAAAKTQQRYKDGDQDLTSSGTKPDLTAKGAEVKVKLTTEEAGGVSLLEDKTTSTDDLLPSSTAGAAEMRIDAETGIVTRFGNLSDPFTFTIDQTFCEELYHRDHGIVTGNLGEIQLIDMQCIVYKKSGRERRKIAGPAMFTCEWTPRRGGISTQINAPVGQLAIGNANNTNQGSGNNFVAEPGSDGNTTQPGTTAGSQAVAAGRDINIHGGVLVFCGISVLFLCFFLLLLFGSSPRFLQSYSTSHDEI